MTHIDTSQQPFSVVLEDWLKSKKPKTIGSMLDLFDEKSFAFIFFILLLFPALPLPTGGLTHVFEAIAILLALQLVIGREELWLPEKLKNKKIPQSLATKILPYTQARLRWLEKFSKVRGKCLIDNVLFRSQLGVVVIIFTAAAFVAPPFSFLDTLPSLAVVLISLGVILDDIYVITAGYITGIVGVVLVYILGASIFAAITHLF